MMPDFSSGILESGKEWGDKFQAFKLICYHYQPTIQDTEIAFKISRKIKDIERQIQTKTGPDNQDSTTENVPYLWKRKNNSIDNIAKKNLMQEIDELRKIHQCRKQLTIHINRV